MRRLHLAGGTGGSRRYADSSEVEADDGGFGLEAGSGEQDGIWQPLHRVREYDRSRGLPKAAFEASSQPLDPNGIALHGGHSGLHGRAKPRDIGNILGSRPPPLLLSAAAQQRLKPQEILGQDKGASALGAAELMRR